MTLDDEPSVESPIFDPEKEAHIAEFDNSTVSPSTAVVVVVGEITQQPTTELPPLFNVVNTDALDRFIEEPTCGQYHGERSIRFTYLEYRIKVQSGGIIEVYPSDRCGDERETDS
jgi:hypothetical protein